MKDFSELKGQQPEWRQPKSSGRVYELRLNDDLFAVLTFRSAFGSFATAEYSGGKYTFKRVGFFTTHVTIRREGEEIDLAAYHPHWAGSQGMLELDGRTFSWRPTNFWATRFAWYAGKEVLLLYRQGVEDKHLSDFFKTQAQVEFTDDAWNIQGLPLMVMLGWYLVVLHEQDSAAAAAAAAAAS